MSGLGNAKIFAQNLRYYLEKSGKTSKQLAEIIGVATPTFSEWLNGKKYPRIDKIEKLANYFGIQKSDLIEDHSRSDVSYMPYKYSDTRVLCSGFEEMPPETRAMIMGMFNAAYAQFKQQQQQQGKDEDDDTADET